MEIIFSNLTDDTNCIYEHICVAIKHFYLNRKSNLYNILGMFLSRMLVFVLRIYVNSVHTIKI